MTQLSPNFSLSEMTASDAAARHNVSNVPTGQTLANLTETAKKMERVRQILGRPIIVTSGYRSPAVNKIIGGADTSAHTLGYAVDFKVPGLTPFEVCKALKGQLSYDQLIFEYAAWTHISFDPRSRGQELSIWNGSGGYKAGIVKA